MRRAAERLVHLGVDRPGGRTERARIKTISSIPEKQENQSEHYREGKQRVRGLAAGGAIHHEQRTENQHNDGDL